MVGALFVVVRHDAHEAIFDFANIFSRREIDAVGNPENVGVDRDRGFAERRIENDVGRFSTDPG